MKDLYNKTEAPLTKLVGYLYPSFKKINNAKYYRIVEEHIFVGDRSAGGSSMLLLYVFNFVSVH